MLQSRNEIQSLSRATVSYIRSFLAVINYLHFRNRGSTNDSDFEKIYQIFRRSKTVECPKLSTFSKKNLQRLKKITEDKWTKTDKKFMEYVRYVKWKRGEVILLETSLLSLLIILDIQF